MTLNTIDTPRQQETTAMSEPAEKSSKATKKPENSAQLTLETFILYKWLPATNQYEFFPEPRQVRKIDGNMVVTLNDVPFPVGVPHPKNALTALYGFRDSLEELQRHLKYARENEMGNIKVSFKVTVRNINMGTTDLNNLNDTDFLNLRRLKKELGQIIIDGVTSRLAKEASKTDRKIETVDTILQACRRPDLVCDVIRSEEIFSHIKVVAYMIPDEENSNRGRQVATILTDRVEEISYRGDMPFDVELPRLSA